MAFFFLSDVRLLASVLGSFLRRWRLAYWRFFNGTFPFKTFRAHSLKQSKSCLSHCFHFPCERFFSTLDNIYLSANSFWHVDGVCFARKYITAQPQRLVLLVPQIQEQIRERVFGRQFIGFHRVATVVRKNLPRQVDELTAVSGWFKKYEVLCRASAHSSHVFVAIEQILHDVYDGVPSMVRTARKNVVRFHHRVVAHDQSVVSLFQFANGGHALTEIYLRIFVETWLIFHEVVDRTLRRRFEAVY